MGVGVRVGAVSVQEGLHRLDVLDRDGDVGDGRGQREVGGLLVDLVGFRLWARGGVRIGMGVRVRARARVRVRVRVRLEVCC